VIRRYEIPTQSCVLTHVTTVDGRAIERGAPVDLVFQSIGGTQKPNAQLRRLARAAGRGGDAARLARRGTVGDNVMYFETGQGSALSANAHHGVDQQTSRPAPTRSRAVPAAAGQHVVGFIGPEYLYDGKQIVRAGLEDHFCGKLLGLPMGCDVCYTNHAEADQDDMDTLLTLLGVAGVNFVMGVPGADDIMLNYQSTSFHDALYLRQALGLRPAPEFEAWLERMGIAMAVEAHAAAFLETILPRLDADGWRVAPLAIVEQGRVAVADEVGALLHAKLSVILIGERPGLSSPDSLGLYLTWDPLPGRSNAERNCISNIRPPEGLSYALAAHKLHFLMTESRRRKALGRRPQGGRAGAGFDRNAGPVGVVAWAGTGRGLVGGVDRLEHRARGAFQSTLKAWTQ
jgi:hypothetical protein